MSRADYWLIEYDDKCRLMLPTSLVKDIARKAYDEGLIRNGGDNHNKGVLVPLERFLHPYEHAAIFRQPSK